MKDILRYVSHSDPQLKGNIAVVIGHLLRAFLTEGRGSFDRWLQSTGLAEGSELNFICRTLNSFCILKFVNHVFCTLHLWIKSTIIII